MTTPASPAETIGDHLQAAADALCHARATYPQVLTARIAQEPGFRSWEQAAEVTKITATDFIDGVLARLGSRISGRPTTTDGSRLDGDADKDFHRATLEALARRAEADGEQIYANSLRRSLVTNVDRDARVDAFRDGVATVNEDLDPEDQISTSAVFSGRAKTWANSFGHVVAVSPLAKRAPGRAVAASLFAVGDHLAIKSERDLRTKVGQQMAELGIQAAAESL